MKIRKIDYENFRNFKDAGTITCSTDGKITVIYGENGDGKTTLHQLLHWVFYGTVNFNKTATEALYNIVYENELTKGEMVVKGAVEFEHAGKVYLLHRTQNYYKDVIDGTKATKMECSLYCKENSNWKLLTNEPMVEIEKLLPSGLREYFFFDGESMIADLKVKSEDSAKKLKTTLFSMFELDVLNNAITHIGGTGAKRSVIGKLHLKKGDGITNSAIASAQYNMGIAEDSKTRIAATIDRNKKRINELEESIKILSEEIGSNKTHEQFENDRRKYQRQQEIFEKNVDSAKDSFGKEIINRYPKLLISKASKDAQDKIQLKISTSKLPFGLTKELVQQLLSDESKICVCGNPMCDSMRSHIKSYLDMLPPKSYESIYQNFVRTVDMWGDGYDASILSSYIADMVSNIDQIQTCEEEIRNIDKAEKESRDIQDLVTERTKAEREIKEINAKMPSLNIELKKAELAWNKYNKEYEQLVKGSKAAADVQERIEVMQKVRSWFENKLKLATEDYSRELEKNIQYLIDAMLTSKRTVNVNKNFAISVFDSLGNESKSEGQFAIVSFAYIGGIFKMLKSKDELKNKEYPLVLDGPFSKLDAVHIHNVVNIIPQFAPQIVLFSKDSLQDVIPPDMLGRVWTISSNKEKNVAVIKEGCCDGYKK